MCCSKGSAPQQTTIQQQTTAPQPWQIPYFTGGVIGSGPTAREVPGVLPTAASIYEANPSFDPFPGALTAPFSPETEQAFGLTTNRALGGSPVMNAANADLQKTLEGGYLNGQTPGYQAMVDRIRAGVMPGTSAQFANSGDGGGLKQRALGQGLGDALGALNYQNYGDERNRMMQANLFAPQAAQSDYYDIAQLGNVGAAKEALTQQQMNEAAQKYQQEQMAPWGPLGLYGGTVLGNYGGTTTGTSTTELPRQNPFASALGIGLGLTGIGGATGAFGSGGWLSSLFK